MMSKDDCRMMSKDSRYARNTESGCNGLRVINKIRRPQSGSPIVNHEYDYRQNWTTQSPVTTL